MSGLRRWWLAVTTPLGVLVVVVLGLLAVAPAARAAADGSLVLPLYVSTRGTLAAQFGYAPDFTRNIPAFDSGNRPYIRSRTASQDDTSYVNVLEGGVWQRFTILAALEAAYPDFAGTFGAGGYNSDRVVFDSLDRAYTFLTIRLEEGELKNVLLYSLDRCVTWRVRELPFGDAQPVYDQHNFGNVACEYFTGHNLTDQPPFLALWRERSDWPGDWATRNELWVVQPYFDGDTLVVPQPTFVTDRFLGMVQCAGGGSFAATSGGRTFFVWAEVTDTPRNGTPTYVGVYDRQTRGIIARRLLCRAMPGNDVHDTPAICLDSKGLLHVVSGAHNRPMRYLRSLAPGSISSWTAPTDVLKSGYVTKGTDADGAGQQTYVSLVCGPDDTLHLVCRQMRRGIDQIYWPSWYSPLVYLHKTAGASRWSRPRQLVIPADGGGYMNYYQKLTLDRRGTLYLSLSLSRTDDPTWERALSRFRQRMVLSSADGESWRLADTASMTAGLLSAPPSP